jgi:hypothetical protein
MVPKSGVVNARTRPSFSEEGSLDLAPSAIQLGRGTEPLDTHHGIRPVDDELVPVPCHIRPDLASDAGAAAAKEIEHCSDLVGQTAIGP